MKESEIKEKIQEGWLRIRIIQELAGFPVEHVESTMDSMNGRLASMDDVKILEREVHEAKEVSKGIWSMFADIELLVKDFATIIILLFDFMPSSIEIIEPEDYIKTDVRELSSAINDLVGKMHHLDASAKKFLALSNKLKKKLDEAGIKLEPQHSD